MQRTRSIAWALLAGAALYLVAAPAEAKPAKYVDEDRGFSLQIDSMFEQVPPKLTGGREHVIGEFYSDKAKYAGRQPPTIKLFWFSTSKGAVITPSGNDPASDDAGKEDEPDDKDLTDEEKIAIDVVLVRYDDEGVLDAALGQPVAALFEHPLPALQLFVREAQAADVVLDRLLARVEEPAVLAGDEDRIRGGAQPQELDPVVPAHHLGAQREVVVVVRLELAWIAERKAQLR